MITDRMRVKMVCGLRVTRYIVEQTEMANPVMYPRLR